MIQTFVNLPNFSFDDIKVQIVMSEGYHFSSKHASNKVFFQK